MLRPFERGYFPLQPLKLFLELHIFIAELRVFAVQI